jgi:hypothetical protein
MHTPPPPGREGRGDSQFFNKIVSAAWFLLWQEIVQGEQGVLLSSVLCCCL